MKIEMTKFRGKKKDATKEVHLYRIGKCLAVEDKGILIQFKLTPEQWKLLADSAKNAIEELN